MRNTHHSICAALFVVVGGGCVGDPAMDQTPGVQLSVEEHADTTTIRGIDDAGTEVARLELVHGRFTVTPMFASDFDTPTVVGRKLDVYIRGDQRLAWETAGFEPTLRLPAHPAAEVELAAFMDEALVQQLLARWQIGFQPSDASSLDAEAAYGWSSGGYSGWDVTTCGSTSCGMIQGKNVNMCNGGSAYAGARATQNFSTGVDQWKLAQCCPAGSGGESQDWFAIKTCPTAGTTSECGTGSGACKGCPQYPISPGECIITTTTSSVGYRFYKCNPGEICY